MGLRERSWLVSAGSRIVGASPEPFLPFALSAECFIAAALTSDDVLDVADERWGTPSCLNRWGSRNAMLIAEHLHGLAQLALDRVSTTCAGFDHQGVSDAVREFREHYGEFFAWQFIDVANEGRERVPMTTVLDLAYRRTGRLLHACVAAPARVLRASPATREALESYGRAIGTLLQLRDDVLDFSADRAHLGKPILGDLINGQPNLVLHFALASEDPPADLDFIHEIFGCKRRLTSEEEQAAIVAIVRSGALHQATQILLEHGAAGEAAAATLPEGNDREELLFFLGALVDVPA
jgi:geranylgeranyl pyrophosphate synthase